MDEPRWFVEFYSPTVVMDIPLDMSVPINLGRPFLATVGAKIDVQAGKISLTIGEEEIEFHFNKTLSGPIQESMVELAPTYKEAPKEEVHKIEEVPEKKELSKEEMEKELPGFLPREKKKDYVIGEDDTIFMQVLFGEGVAAGRKKYESMKTRWRKDYGGNEVVTQEKRPWRPIGADRKTGSSKDPG